MSGSLFTGTAGVPPAASAKREPDSEEASSCRKSRLTALLAGETPAVPVKKLNLADGLSD
jgi:hypothetical protein